MLILPRRSSIQVHTQYVSLQYPRIFQPDLGSLDPSYRENLMEQTFDVCLLFPVSVGVLPTVTQVRGNFYLKMTSKQGFLSSPSLSANRVLWNLCSFDGWKAKKRVVFRNPSISNCLDSKMWELQVCTEPLISKVTTSMFPHISEPCEPIPRPYWDCPWGNRLCVWECWGPSSFVTKGFYTGNDPAARNCSCTKKGCFYNEAPNPVLRKANVPVVRKLCKGAQGQTVPLAD